MAIYHLHAKVISRGKGRNAVAAAAYRRAAKMFDEREGQTFNYLNKCGVIYSEILLPENSPTWLEEYLGNDLEDHKTSERLWNLIESIEKRVDSQLAREVEFSLPIELTREQNIKLAREFIINQFIGKGMVADWSVHWDEDNPHVHVLLSMRSIETQSFGKKVTHWNTRSLLLDWRREWAEHANRTLAFYGHDMTIDYRSNETRGISSIPTKHLGLASSAVNKIIQGIEHFNSVFTLRELAIELSRHMENSDRFAFVLEQLKQSPQLLPLGLGEDGREHYTTRKMFELENNVQYLTDSLSKKSHLCIRPSKITMVLGQYELRNNRVLTNEQQAALKHLLQQKSITCMVGRAGTGKSFSLAAAREIWEASGVQVYGIALSGIASDGLKKDAGFKAATIASFLSSARANPNLINRNDVIVMDEAGMCDSHSMFAVLNLAHHHGAKVVLVGDPQQLQPVGPGACFRAIIERVGFTELQTIYRQKVVWQQEATTLLAKGKVFNGLSLYQTKGNIHLESNSKVAIDQLVTDWFNTRSQSHDDLNEYIVITHRNEDVRILNEAIRQKRIDRNEIGSGHTVSTRQGDIAISVGDRIIFTANDQALGVSNGRFGTVLDIKSQSGRTIGFDVRLDGQKDNIYINPEEYKAFAHGYAATVHKTQGITVQHAFVYVGSRSWDRHLTYVAMSRHKEDCHLYADQTMHKNIEILKKRLSRYALKDSVLDYPYAFSQRRGLETSGQKDNLVNHLFKRLQLIKENIESWLYPEHRQKKQSPLQTQRESPTRKRNAKSVSEYIELQRTVQQSRTLVEVKISELEVTDQKSRYKLIKASSEYQIWQKSVRLRNEKAHGIIKLLPESQAAIDINNLDLNLVQKYANTHLDYLEVLRYVTYCREQGKELRNNLAFLLAKDIKRYYSHLTQLKISIKMLKIYATQSVKFSESKAREERRKKLSQDASELAVKDQSLSLDKLLKLYIEMELTQENLLITKYSLPSSERLSINEEIRCQERTIREFALNFPKDLKIIPETGFDKSENKTVKQLGGFCAIRDRLNNKSFSAEDRIAVLGELIKRKQILQRNMSNKQYYNRTN